MAERIKGLQIDLSMRDTGISKTLAGVKREFRSLNSSMKLSGNNFKYGEKSASSYKARMNDLDGAIKVGTSNLSELEKQYNEVSQAQGTNSAKAVRLQTEYNKQANSINAMQHELSGLSDAYVKNFSTMGKTGTMFKSIGSGMQDVGSKAQAMGNSLTNSITKPALIAGVAMGGITAKLGFDRLVGLDSAKAKLEGLGYSTKEVGSITDQVTNAIKGGMTTMAEGTDVAAGALAAGVKEGKELEKYIKLVGDAAVGSNRPVGEMAQIFNRVQGMGKLMTQELNMVEEGMPGFAAAMSKNLGVSQEEFRKMVTAGEVSSEDFMTVMDDFAGGMAAAYSKSWKGMVQNTKAYIGILGESLLGGVFTQSKESLREFEKLLQSPAAQQWAKETGQSIGAAFSAMIGAIQSVVNWWNSLGGTTQKVLGSVIKWLGITLITLGPVLTIFGKMTTVIGGMFGPLGSLFQNLGKVAFASKQAGSVMVGLTSVFPKLGAAIAFATGPIGLTIAAIVALGAAFVIAYKKSETFRNIVNGAVNGVVVAFKWLWSGIMTVLTPIGNAIAKFGRELAKTFGQFWAENGPQFMQALNNIKTGFMVVWSIIRPILSGIGSLFKAVFSGILSFIKFIMPGIQAVFKAGWAIVKYIFVSTWQAIKGVVNGGLNIIMGLIKVFSGLFTGDFRKMWEGVKQIFFGALQFVWNLVQLWFVGKIFGVFKLGLNLIKKVVSGSLGSVKGTFSSVLSAIWGFVKKIFTSIGNFTRSVFNGIWKFTKAVWSNIKLAITNPVAFIQKWVTSRFRGMSGAVKAIFSGLKKAIQVIFSTMRTVVVNIAKALSNALRGNFSGMSKNLRNITTALKNAISKLWRILKDTVVNVAKSLWSGVRDKFNALKKSTSDITQKLKNTVTDKWTGLKKSVVNLATGAKDGVVKGFKGMYDKGVEWLDKLKGFIKNAKDGFKKVASDLGKGVANGAISGLNAMIDGINTLSDKIMKKKLIKNKIKPLSTGTAASPGVQTNSQGQLTKSTRAVVNDKGLGNARGPGGHKEIIQRKNGKFEQPKGRNKLVRLKRGDAVHNGIQSKSLRPHLSTGTGMDLLGKAKKHKKHEEVYGDVPANTKGGGGSWNPATAIADGSKGAWDWTKDQAKKAKDTFGKAIGDVMDYATNPGKLIGKVMKHFGVDFSGVSGEAMGGTMSWAYDGLKKGLKDLVSGWFSELEGEGDGGYIDLSKGINFPYSPDGRAPGYPFAGPHMGVDINYIYDKLYSVLSGKATARKGWNGGFGNMVDIVSGATKVIYGHMSKHAFSGSKQVKPGDYLGVSGNSGRSSGPHLHFEVQKNGQPINPLDWLKKNNGGGKGSGKWKPQVKKALKMNGLPTSGKYVNAWLKQIQTESGGNAKAMGGTDGLADGRAQGLVQVKPGTFNANKFKGHGNIMNGLDNLLAGIRYAHRKYGNGGLGVVGKGHGYATGGLINNSGMYQLAEDGYPEFVIPTDPSRQSDAMKLLAIASRQIEGNKRNKRPNQMRTPSTSSSNSSDNTNLLMQMIGELQEQNGYLKEIVRSNKSIEGQPKGFTERDVSKAQGRRSRNQTYLAGGAY
ncbi:peptidoglycan DD-metalloendopeptidase family protein [Staphylococcus xylosus]|uniref:peptidoglycan DD-metalloendopeptidase family protein n=1 Tax=Staphylococcus xylosus TaxID=1288 RepID=UPI003364EDEC